VVVRHSSLQVLQLKLKGKDVFVFSNLVRTKHKIINKIVQKASLMAKSGPGIMVSLDLSLINMVVVISTNNNLRACKEIKKSSISIDMGITFKHKVDATQLYNTTSAEENFLTIKLRTNIILP
jgi:hypothetical protein